MGMNIRIRYAVQMRQYGIHWRDYNRPFDTLTECKEAVANYRAECPNREYRIVEVRESVVDETSGVS